MGALLFKLSAVIQSFAVFIVSVMKTNRLFNLYKSPTDSLAHPLAYFTVCLLDMSMYT